MLNYILKRLGIRFSPYSSNCVYIEKGHVADISSMFYRLNEIRRSKGLNLIYLQDELCITAINYAKEMYDSNRFSHTDKTGNSPFERVAKFICKENITWLGENIAIADSLENAQENLEHSKGHFKNMINTNFDKLGLGAYSDGKGRIYICQLFGKLKN
jgi:uncharacterized protein YkwD